MTNNKIVNSQMLWSFYTHKSIFTGARLNAEQVTQILMIRTYAFYTDTFDISGIIHFHSELHRVYFVFSQQIP